MMDSKLILIKSVSLLFCESRNQETRGKSDVVILKAVDKLKLPEQVVESDNGRNAIIGLRDTVTWMLSNKDTEFDSTSLLQRIAVNIGDDLTTYNTCEVIKEYEKLPEEELVKVCNQLHNELQSLYSQMMIKEIVNKANRDLFYNNKAIDWSSYVDLLIDDLSSHTRNMNVAQKTMYLDIMNMGDPEALAKIFQNAKEEAEGIGGFRSGWQALNRMLGDGGVFKRGEFCLVGAVTHNYKSGFCSDLFRHFCTLNDPVLKNPEKKPLLLYISTENTAEKDLMRMYIALKENETLQPVNPSTVDPVEAAKYISSRLTERGFDVVMKRMDGGDFDYTRLCQMVIEYEDKGYEIQAVVFDYLALIDKQDLGRFTMTGEDVRTLIQKTRTFMNARDILFITPHQLSQDAVMLKRSGVNNFVAELAGKNYWDGSKRIANEADLEIYLDIVLRDGKFWLAVQRGKHRCFKDTPAKHRHFYLPFSDVGYIPNDIDKEDSSRRHLVSELASAGVNWED